MSVKGNRTKNLGTVVECAETADDSNLLSTANESADPQIATADGRSSHYETASSKFSTGDDTAVECSTARTEVSSPSESAELSITLRHNRNPSDSITSKSRSDTSPRNSRRKHSSAADSCTSDSSVDLTVPAASKDSRKKKRTNRFNGQTSTSAPPKRFSLTSLLNNVTAPVRRGKEDKPTSSASSSFRDQSAGLPPKDRKFPKSRASTATDEKSRKVIAEPSADLVNSQNRQPLTTVNSTDNIGTFRRRYMDSLSNEASDSSEMIECPVCCVLQASSQYPHLTNCSHRTCRNCLENYLQIEIMESRVVVNCTECSAPIHPNDIYTTLCMNQALLERYERFMIRRILLTDPDTRWCPAPDCDYACIAQNCAACPQLECGRPGCNTLFCYHCKGEWHPQQTCDEARGKSAERMFASAGGSSGQTAAGIVNALSGSSGSSSEKSGDLKACPRCHTLIIKLNDGSCNHLVCPICQADFCWLCLKEISDLHYLSPTGCTFWGKKPWTRKKKLLWQIGTLIGAPVGIALIAGLAVPGIVCGVPVFVGRKIYQRFSHQSRLRRRLITAASVAGSLIVSPVLAVMAVGVGVPIMLAYVYGVVPLSLCRNGGCGGGDQTDSAALAEAAAAVASAAFNEETIGDLNQTEDTPRGLGSSTTNGPRFPRSLHSYLADENVRLLRHARRDPRTTSPDDGLNFSIIEKNPSRTQRANATQPDVVSASSSKLCGPSDSQRRRKLSAESYANSLGERLNYDNASTKANAGSHYQFDSKSVHTVCSGAEAQSYCEDIASVQAACGSITDSASVRMNRQYRTNSRPERDLSPSSINSLGDSRSLIMGIQKPLAVSPQLSTVAVDFAPLPTESNAERSNQTTGGEFFRFRTFMDNLRQILNDEVADDGDSHEFLGAKRKNTKSHNSSSTDISVPPTSISPTIQQPSTVAAKVRYDQNSRALSVQMPASSASSARRSMPALNVRPVEPASVILTPTGTVLTDQADVQNSESDKSAKRSRRSRLANFFRSFRSSNSYNVDSDDVERQQTRRNKKAPAV
ncbi:RBR-type E3 ubiquitin transferase [Aphelenchoides besseyi]|nr:RBR-type E3 ubiquitin transferase [Aphelenchoides besseyi]